MPGLADRSETPVSPPYFVRDPSIPRRRRLICGWLAVLSMPQAYATSVGKALTSTSTETDGLYMVFWTNAQGGRESIDVDLEQLDFRLSEEMIRLHRGTQVHRLSIRWSPPGVGPQGLYRSLEQCEMSIVSVSADVLYSQ